MTLTTNASTKSSPSRIDETVCHVCLSDKNLIKGTLPVFVSVPSGVRHVAHWVSPRAKYFLCKNCDKKFNLPKQSENGTIHYRKKDTGESVYVTVPLSLPF